MAEEKLIFDDYPFLKELGLEKENMGCYKGNGKWEANGEWHTAVNPHNNQPIAKVKWSSVQDYEECITIMEKAKAEWMSLPIPARGEIVRQIGDALRQKKEALGMLISLEMGKIKSEGLGEVQEFIDMCDFACGNCRSLEGKVLPSERPEHFMMECWNPLGIVGVVTAFNFPCAVMGWNSCNALVCGDQILWKGAESASLLTIAQTKIIAEVLEKNNLPAGILCTVQGGRDIGEKISSDSRIPLVSFTGSTKIGQIVAKTVHGRFGKSILELGGNNAVIMMEDAALELAIKGSVFSAVGTCGQRCTTLRRLLVQEKIYEEVKEKFISAYKSIPIGDPLDSKTLCGPLHSKAQVKIYEDGLKEIEKQGGKILYGGKVIEEKKPGNYVLPTIVEIEKNASILKEELFVPILYIVKFKTLEEAIEINNSVPQGLSSSLFTNNIQNYYKWIGPLGSDCGLVNCNIGPSGAEIGGAFGGEKETGGGREAGSDAWKQYMRRSTCTINFGKTLPLAQGVKFDF